MSEGQQSALSTIGRMGVEIAHALRLGISPNTLAAKLRTGATGEVCMDILDYAVKRQKAIDERTKSE